MAVVSLRPALASGRAGREKGQRLPRPLAGSPGLPDRRSISAAGLSSLGTCPSTGCPAAPMCARTPASCKVSTGNRSHREARLCGGVPAPALHECCPWTPAWRHCSPCSRCRQSSSGHRGAARNKRHYGVASPHRPLGPVATAWLQCSPWVCAGRPPHRRLPRAVPGVRVPGALTGRRAAFSGSASSGGHFPLVPCHGQLVAVRSCHSVSWRRAQALCQARPQRALCRPAQWGGGGRAGE